MLCVISLMVGLVLGGMIGGVVLLLAHCMPASRSVLVDTAVAETRKTASAHWA